MLTDIPEKWDEWYAIIAKALQQAQENHQTKEAEFLTAMLAVLSGQVSTLPEGHPYAEALHETQAGIAAGRLEHREVRVGISAEVIEAVRDFVNADDWDASRQVVEARQTLLFQPEMEVVFEQSIANARSSEEQRWAETLELHLALLRRCKAIGIAEALKELEGTEEQQEDGEDIPFDPELMTRSVEALLGSAQEKWLICSTPLSRRTGQQMRSCRR